MAASTSEGTTTTMTVHHPLALQNQTACETFLKTASPREIAAQIRQDHHIATGGLDPSNPHQLPSLLVHFLPKTPATGAAAKATRSEDVHLADKIAIELSVPLASASSSSESSGLDADVNYLRPPLPLSICRLRYTSILSTIKSYTTTHSFSPAHNPNHNNLLLLPPTPTSTPDHPTTDGTLPPPVASTGGLTAHLVPTPADLLSTLKVLSYLQLPRYGALHLDTPLDVITTTVQNLLTGHSSSPSGKEPTPAATTTTATPTQTSLPPPPRPKKRSSHCYICQYAIPPHLHHPYYPHLCRPCGDFNTTSSLPTLPAHLAPLLPRPFTAVVTGARVNLGYYTALRLLRCGAHVLATSRYPWDAAERYATEADFGVWKGRLKVIGADFRSARDAFALVEGVGRWLDEEVWNIGGGGGGEHGSRGRGGMGKLSVLINNAAQTLTDGRGWEEGMVEREEAARRRLLLPSTTSASSSPSSNSNDLSHLLLHHHNSTTLSTSTYSGYTPRVGGGIAPIHPPTRLLPNPHADGTPDHDSDKKGPTGAKSSWSQTLDEIPYQDIITAHSINAFVPLILMRELLPRLSLPHPHPLSNPPPNTPNGYIVTLTSRESLQEMSPSQATKQGKHVHTNMSKAAVNMLVHTQASEAWKGGRVAVVAVDPGYMSADGKWVEECVRRRERRRKRQMEGDGEEEEEEEEERECPLDWDDGVGRTLWVVAKGQKGEPVWGRVLKHFTAVRG